ncbi:DNA-binding protein [Brachybacterium alimentarium]|nr:DNA-binding protein [Brachybacterium alimentarium]
METMMVTVTEAAALTARSSRAIRRALTANGDQGLPHVVTGGKILIAVSDLRSWASA